MRFFYILFLVYILNENYYSLKYNNNLDSTSFKNKIESYSNAYEAFSSMLDYSTEKFPEKLSPFPWYPSIIFNTGINTRIDYHFNKLTLNITGYLIKSQVFFTKLFTDRKKNILLSPGIRF